MENIILEIVNTYGMELLKAVFMLIFGALGLIACKVGARLLNTETKRTLARTGVMFVEQAYKDLHGEAKMGKFLEWASSQLKRYGIKYDADEMRALAEACLAEFNNAFTKYGNIVVADGVGVDSLTDDQLRDILKQIGVPVPMSFTREDMLAAIDASAEQANT